MDKKEAIKAVKNAKKLSRERNFKESIDLIINLKDLDLKDSKNQIDDFVELHHPKGKKIKICALVGGELESAAKKVCDKVVREDEFKKYDKKKAKKLADEFDYFIAQANVMPKIASAFGPVFGPRGKMPSPKAGCIVPPKGNIKPVYDKLQKLVKLTTKKGASVKALIGNEEMEEEKVADNLLVAYNHFVHMLPQRENNVKNVMVKTTMGKPIKVGEEIEEEKLKKKGAKKRDRK